VLVLPIPFLTLVDDTSTAKDATSSTIKSAKHVAVVRRDIKKFIIIIINSNVTVTF